MGGMENIMKMGQQMGLGKGGGGGMPGAGGGGGGMPDMGSIMKMM